MRTQIETAVSDLVRCHRARQCKFGAHLDFCETAVLKGFFTPAVTDQTVGPVMVTIFDSDVFSESAETPTFSRCSA